MKPNSFCSLHDIHFPKLEFLSIGRMSPSVRSVASPLRVLEGTNRDHFDDILCGLLVEGHDPYGVQDLHLSSYCNKNSFAVDKEFYQSFLEVPYG